MAIPAGSIVEIKYEYSVNGQTCMNVLHYTALIAYPNENPTLVVPELLTVAAGTGVGTIPFLMAQAQGNNVSWIRTTAQMIYPTRYIVWQQATALTGAQPTPCTAQNVALVIEKHGEQGARNNTGSFHLGGVASGLYSAGLTTVNGLLALQALADKLDDDLNEAVYGTNWDAAILNKVAIPNTDPTRYEIAGSTPIFQVTAKQTVRTMRRRTVGLGI